MSENECPAWLDQGLGGRPFCEKPGGHDGDHRRGHIIWSNDAARLAAVEALLDDTIHHACDSRESLEEYVYADDLRAAVRAEPPEAKRSCPETSPESGMACHLPTGHDSPHAGGHPSGGRGGRLHGRDTPQTRPRPPPATEYPRRGTT